MRRFLKEWLRDYAKGALSVVVTLLLALLIAWGFGYGFNPLETGEYYLARVVALARSPKVTIGSCYPCEYGLDNQDCSMRFVPFPVEPITCGNPCKLWLALQNDERLISLEDATLHVSFPQGSKVQDDQGVDLWDMAKKRSPWLCLGTGNTSCYLRLGDLHPVRPGCFEAMTVTFPSVGQGVVYPVSFQVVTKNRPHAKGRFFVRVR